KDENAKKREVRSNQDLVTIKLNDLHQTLENQRAIQKNRVWFDSGIKQVSELLYQTDLLDDLPQHIVTFIVKYLQANQAAIFVKDLENQEIEYVQMGTYAYERKKFITSKIKLNEGLVGQCAAEKETIFISDVPKNYVKITSGLGEATPTCVAIVPFIQNNEVIAVLEICSFSVFTSNEIQFLETAGKNIASAFLNQNLNQKTKKLLLESQQNINIMSSNEEELRQNLEEMSAIQEDFTRKEAKYISELEITKQEFNAEKEQLINLLEEYKTKNEHQSLQNNHLHLQYEKEKKVFVAKIQEMQRVIYKNHLHDVKNAVDLVDDKKPIQKKYPRSIEFYLDA
ncbi:MAG: GAF domain-containing protein, partial [Cytophagales bacterium]